MQNLNQIKDSDPRIIKTENNRKLSIDGQSRNFPVYSIPLDYLFYNDKNARIATFINKYKNENQLDEFDTSDLEAYNSIIEEFIVNSNPEAIKKTILKRIRNKYLELYYLMAALLMVTDVLHVCDN